MYVETWYVLLKAESQHIVELYVVPALLTNIQIPSSYVLTLTLTSHHIQSSFLLC